MENTQQNNTGMWVALAVLGGVVAYSMVKRDAVAVTETVTEGVKVVADLANPISHTNVINRGITATGEAMTGRGKGSWSVGTQFHKWVEPDYDRTGDPKDLKANQPKKPETRLLDKVFDYFNPAIKAERERTYQQILKDGQAKARAQGVQARQRGGKWFKLINGQWQLISRHDKIVKEGEKYFARPFNA